uniref:Uncharacterized protein n=1 Tax=Knipowitschia caucasica TaxID=637954 RepID=A0AAV2J8A0_KNICA
MTQPSGVMFNLKLERFLTQKKNMKKCTQRLTVQTTTKQKMTKAFIFSWTPVIQSQCKMRKTSPVMWMSLC